MTHDGIIFDLDGTLTDSATGLVGCLRFMHERMGWPVPPDAELRRWLGPPVRTMLLEHGHSPATADAALDAFREHLLATGIYENEVYRGVADMLDALLAAGVPAAVATFKLQGDADLVIDHFGLRDRFAGVHGRIGDEGGHSKAPVIARALASLDLAADARVVMVGDRLHDIDSAKELGLDTIGVAYGYGGAAELAAAGADLVVSSVDELSDALLGAATRDGR